MIISFNGKTPLIHPSVYISEGVYIIGDVEIDEGSSVWFGSVIRGDVNFIRIGKDVSVQDGTIIHVTNTYYPTKIGNRVVIGHRAVIHGCEIGDNVLIGMGAILMDGVKVGNNCIIAAGSLVTEKTEVPDFSILMGQPARVVKKADESILKRVEEGIRNYKQTIELYKRSR